MLYTLMGIAAFVGALWLVTLLLGLFSWNRYSSFLGLRDRNEPLQRDLKYL